MSSNFFCGSPRVRLRSNSFNLSKFSCSISLVALDMTSTYLSFIASLSEPSIMLILLMTSHLEFSLSKFSSKFFFARMYYVLNAWNWAGYLCFAGSTCRKSGIVGW